MWYGKYDNDDCVPINQEEVKRIAASEARRVFEEERFKEKYKDVDLTSLWVRTDD